MKYIIKRNFSFNKKKYEIDCDLKTLCKAKITDSKEYNGRYNIKLSNPLNKYTDENSCLVEPDPNQSKSYLIYLQNDKTEKKNLFGQFFYQLCGYQNYLYTIVIGEKLYKVRSCDLKDRRLTIIDTIDSGNTLFQVTDLFSKLNKTYHVTINDKKWQYIYLAIIILLDLHECKPNIS